MNVEMSLHAESTNEDIESLRSDLCRLRDAGRAVRLDARSVCAPTTALIQLIEVAAADFAMHGVSFGLHEPSDALCAAYEELGLFASLMARLKMST